MKSKIVRKPDRETFRRVAREIILEAGAVETPDGFYQYVLATKYGSLRLSINDDYDKSYGSVHTRFSDPELARAATCCNPHSGKWNFYYFGSETFMTLRVAVDSFRGNLVDVLPDSVELSDAWERCQPKRRRALKVTA